MPKTTDIMAHDHDACDATYAKAEAAVADGQWEAAYAGSEEFVAAMQRHFAVEEEVLFPAFEEASGSAMGPTQVMRHEHAQMRQLFAQLQRALKTQDAESWLGTGETLLILMQQHNAKEEQILYPMCDRTLGDAPEELVRRMETAGQTP